MNLAELQTLIAAGESERLEFKKSTADLIGACESLCAFLNSGHEGTVVIGVAGDVLVGQDVTDRTQQEVANALKGFEPKVKIDFHIVPVKREKKAIVLHADAHEDEIPFVYKGRPYWRTGSTTSVMPHEHYQHLTRELIEIRNPYEKFAARGYTIKHIDTRKLNTMVQLAMQLGRIPLNPKATSLQTLEKLQLLTDDKEITNGAMILFGKDLCAYSQCQLHLARFKGKQKGEFLDQKLIRGTAFDLFQEAITFIQRHLPLWGKIESDSPYRKEDYLIPYDAFREAVVNAICHKDYYYEAGDIFIAIYDDRMEIDNGGGLPRGTKLEDLKRAHRSNPRNRVIASVFHYCGLIEQWGQGTQKIIRLCREAKLPEPEFSAERYWFKVTIRAQIQAPVPLAFKEPANLTPQQLRIYRIIAEKQKISSKTLQALCSKIPERSLQRELALLRNKNYILMEGWGPSTHWLLNLQAKHLQDPIE